MNIVELKEKPIGQLNEIAKQLNVEGAASMKEIDAARVAGGTLEAYPDRTDIGDLLASIAQQQARDPEHPELRWSGDPGPFFVDGARVKTAVLAFDEALVWWATEGPIEIRTVRDGDDLVVRASRAGASITPEELTGLFLPRRPGTGGGSKIGLYVVRSVAQALGGSASAQLEDGSVVLELRLPLS